MPAKVCRGLRADTRSKSVDKVSCKHRVYWPDVYFAGMIFPSCLNKVLYQGFQAEDNILKSLHLFHAMHKLVHRRFALAKLHCAIFFPKGLVAHHGIGLAFFAPTALKQLSGQFVESIVVQACGSDNDGFLQQVVHFNLSNHVVFAQRPLTVFKLCKLLSHL